MHTPTHQLNYRGLGAGSARARRGLRALAQVLFLVFFSAAAAWAQRQPSATSLPECYTVSRNATGSAGASTTPRATAPAATAPAAARASGAAGSSCGEFAGFAPAFYQAKGLPELPIKTIRLIFHVMQKDDGSENWKEPSRDGGVDEAILQGYIDGLAAWPAGGSRVGGVNEVYSQLDERLEVVPGAPWPSVATRASPPYNHTRIQFELLAIRYYRDTYGWNMSNGMPTACKGPVYELGANEPGRNQDCMDYLYNRYVTNSATNPGIAGQAAIDPQDKTTVIHVFFGENPGPPGASLDRYGVTSSRYGTGGVAYSVPSKVIMMRGHYWSLRNHPLWAPGLPTNPSDPQASFRYSRYVMAHELGHCLGLWHPFDGVADCTRVYGDPTNPGESKSNNLMDRPAIPGLSLSQCQIGAMHDALSSGAMTFNSAGPSVADSYVDEAQTRNHWAQLPTQNNIIRTNQTWSTTHNLRGNLYVETGAVLIVKCRVGMLGATTVGGGGRQNSGAPRRAAHF